MSGDTEQTLPPCAPIQTPVGGHYFCNVLLDFDTEEQCENIATHVVESEFTFYFCCEHAQGCER